MENLNSLLLGDPEYDEVRDQYRCKVCGRYFHDLVYHLRVHNINSVEYKRAFGLRRKETLMSKTSMEQKRNSFFTKEFASKWGKVGAERSPVAKPGRSDRLHTNSVQRTRIALEKKGLAPKKLNLSKLEILSEDEKKGEEVIDKILFG